MKIFTFNKKYNKLFNLLKQYKGKACRLFSKIIIRIQIKFYDLLLKIYKGKLDREIKLLKYKVKTNRKAFNKSRTYYMIRYRIL